MLRLIDVVLQVCEFVALLLGDLLVAGDKHGVNRGESRHVDDLVAGEVEDVVGDVNLHVFAEALQHSDEILPEVGAELVGDARHDGFGDAVGAVVLVAVLFDDKGKVGVLSCCHLFLLHKRGILKLHNKNLPIRLTALPCRNCSCKIPKNNSWLKSIDFRLLDRPHQLIEPLFLFPTEAIHPSIFIDAVFLVHTLQFFVKFKKCFALIDFHCS